MGQKVNPTIFRLGKTIKWKNQYFEKKPNEIGAYSFKNVEIKKFITKFFQNNGLIVQNMKLHYLNSNSLHLFISYYLTLKSTSLISETTKQQKIRLLKSKKKIKKKKYFKIKKSLKNYLSYQRIKYNIDLNNAIKAQNYQSVKQIIQNDQKNIKIRRMNLLKLYKQKMKIQNFNKVKTIKFQSFLEKLFRSLQLFLNKNINIYLTIKQLNKDTTDTFNPEKIKRIKKGLVSIKKYERNDFFKEGVNTLFTCSTEPNSANLLAEFLATQLQKLKRHNFFLKFIKSALTIFKPQNIKIKIKGRFNGAPRAKHKIILIGNGVAALTISSKVDYAEKTAFTSNGTLGVKVWIQEK